MEKGGEHTWVSGRDDVVGGEHGALADETQLLTELQVGRVGGLVVVQEHHVNLLAEQAFLLGPHNPLVARPHHDTHGIPQSRKVHEAGDDGGELRVALEAKVLCLWVRLARGVGEEDGAVANVAAEFDHDGRGDLGDERGDDGALLRADVHEVGVAPGVGVDGGEDGGRVVADFGGGFVDVVEQADLTAIVELDCLCLGFERSLCWIDSRRRHHLSPGRHFLCRSRTWWGSGVSCELMCL